MEENKKSPKTAIIITIIIGIVLIVGSIVYNRVTSIEEWVVCKYNGPLEGYEETIKFRYMFDQMYGYYEERTINTTNPDEKEEVIKSMNDFGKDFEKSDELEYTVTSDGLKVSSKLYMQTLSYYEFINEYFSDINISVNSKPNDIVNAFKENYKCKRTRK